MSVTKKAVKGLAWVTMATVIVKLLNFVTKMILARILEPTDFGLIAIALLVVDSIAMFQDMGLGHALIYRKEDHEKASNTAFLIIPAVAVVLYGLIYLVAPFAADFFENNSVEPIIKVMALSIVIHSFGTVPAMRLEKELMFRKKLIPETAPKLIYALVAISLAYLGHGVWSIVYAQLASAFSMVILLWIVSDWKPDLSFDLKVAKELFGYGKFIIGASMVIFVINNVDDAIVGKVLGVEALGFYTIAYTISNMPATNITHLVGRVMFPAYSKLQDDLQALGRAYLKVLKYVSTLSIPAAFGIFIIAPEFIQFILGDKWLPAVPALQVMCVFGMQRSIAATFGPLFQATGNPKILRDISAVNLVILLIVIIPFTQEYGIVGTAMAIIFSSIFTMTWQFFKVARIIDQKITLAAKVLVIPLLNSLLMLITIYGIKQVLPITSAWYVGLLVIAGLISYAVFTYMTDRKILGDIMRMISAGRSE